MRNEVSVLVQTGHAIIKPTNSQPGSGRRCRSWRGLSARRCRGWWRLRRPRRFAEVGAGGNRWGEDWLTGSVVLEDGGNGILSSSYLCLKWLCHFFKGLISLKVSLLWENQGVGTLPAVEVHHRELTFSSVVHHVLGWPSSLDPFLAGLLLEEPGQPLGCLENKKTRECQSKKSVYVMTNFFWTASFGWSFQAEKLRLHLPREIDFEHLNMIKPSLVHFHSSEDPVDVCRGRTEWHCLNSDAFWSFWCLKAVAIEDFHVLATLEHTVTMRPSSPSVIFRFFSTTRVDCLPLSSIRGGFFSALQEGQMLLPTCSDYYKICKAIRWIL